MRLLKILGGVFYAIGAVIIMAVLFCIAVVCVGLVASFGYGIGAVTGVPGADVFGAVIGSVIGLVWFANLIGTEPHRSGRQPIPMNVRAAVIARDAFMCRHCGSTDASTFEIDHVTPHSRGGSDDISNLQTLCRHCNRSKGARFIG